MICRFNMSLIKIIKKALKRTSEEPRQYIGASSIGDPCHRAIWYGLRKPGKKIVPDKLRLTFEIGKRLEDMVLEMLEQAGMNIVRSPKFNCEQYPLFQGTADFSILNDDGQVVSLGEIKTAKNASFQMFQRKGLIGWYPAYYSQVQSYMGMGGVYTTTLMALNKDTSELHEEKLKFDPVYYDGLVNKAMRIGETNSIPNKLAFASPSYFKCKICFYKDYCHGQSDQ